MNMEIFAAFSMACVRDRSVKIRRQSRVADMVEHAGDLLWQDAAQGQMPSGFNL